VFFNFEAIQGDPTTCVFITVRSGPVTNLTVNFFSNLKPFQKMSSELAGGDVTEQWKEGSMWKGTLKLDAVV
jgi:hypothetical protein